MSKRVNNKKGRNTKEKVYNHPTKRRAGSEPYVPVGDRAFRDLVKQKGE